MSLVLEAVFDGTTLRPEHRLELPLNTRVRLHLDVIESAPFSGPVSFLEVIEAQNLDGPPDWSTNFDDSIREPASGD